MLRYGEKVPGAWASLGDDAMTRVVTTVDVAGAWQGNCGDSAFARAIDEASSDPRRAGGYVILASPTPAGRQTVMTTAVRYAGWLRPHADAAAERGVRLLQSTGGIFTTAKPLWQFVEDVERPAFGLLVDAAGPIESAAVTVPTLGRRIEAVRLPASADAAAVWLKRLLGIGSDAWALFNDAEHFAACQRTLAPTIAAKR